MNQKIRKKIVALLMGVCLICTLNVTAHAENSDSTQDDTSVPYVVFGADLTASQKETVMDLLGITQDDLSSCHVLEVTNSEEHQYLDDYLDSSVIGTRALSSVMVTKAQSGAGLSITTQNINYCTVAMYQNALITAGMEDAEVVVAGPFELSGTAALIGTVKAYADMNSTDINEEALETAANELVLTGALGSDLGDSEEASNLIAYVKQKVVSGDLKDEDDIRDAIDEGAQKMGVTLTDTQEDQIVSLMKQIGKLDIDPDALESQAKDIFNQLKDMGLDIDSTKAANLFSRIMEAIIEFFKNIFK